VIYCYNLAVFCAFCRVKYVLFALLFLTVSAFLPAQSGLSPHDEVETLLNTSAVTYGQAARLALDSSETLITTSYEEAFNYAKEQGWLPDGVSADDTARLDRVALIFMKSFNLKGGLFYTISGSAHYAYRELAYINAIGGRTTPNMAVSGEQLLFITGRLLAAREGAQ
jgi:hypothetical protein